MEGVNKNISVEFGKSGQEDAAASFVDCHLLLINPKDAGSYNKSLLEEILNLYMKELPAMNYAANTGKKSSFLKRCVSNGKFRTLFLRLKSVEEPGKVIAAITYQIIPADTQYAEIPLAAVISTYQHKGIGQLLYMELRKRLLGVGISTVLCWGDEESEGFWHKQGFASIAQVDTKGRARRLPIRADIRRALCFPGGSTLMISNLDTNLHDSGGYPIKFRLKSSEKSTSSTDEVYSLDRIGEDCVPTWISAGQRNFQLELNGYPERNSAWNSQELVLDSDMIGNSLSAKVVDKQISLTYERNTKRRVWEPSLSSLKSKRVKAIHLSDIQLYPDSSSDEEHKDDSLQLSHLGLAGVNTPLVNSKPGDLVEDESQGRIKHFNIMLMDIADGIKKAYLTKIIEDLGGAVTSDGSLCTHVLAGKVRRTLNFCTALCSGAWILSPHWLKESSREGRFVDEVPFILKDDDYLMKFRVELKEAIFRARKNPRALFKGYSICLTTHVQPPIEMISAIVTSAGGDVDFSLRKISEKSRMIFIACEEDMEEALLAVKSGVPTFSSDWFMNCIMKQELDLDAPKFVESL